MTCCPDLWQPWKGDGAVCLPAPAQPISHSHSWHGPMLRSLVNCLVKKNKGGGDFFFFFSPSLFSWKTGPSWFIVKAEDCGPFSSLVKPSDEWTSSAPGVILLPPRRFFQLDSSLFFAVVKVTGGNAYMPLLRCIHFDKSAHMWVCAVLHWNTTHCICFVNKLLFLSLNCCERT